jgi:hypothetical protein
MPVEYTTDLERLNCEDWRGLIADPVVEFISQGIMGNPMINHIRSTGHGLVVWDSVPSKMDALISLGAEAGET